VVRSVASWICWLALLTGLWLLFVGAFDRVDVVAGILAAAVAATAAEVVRRQGLLRFRLEPSWVAGAWQVPFRIFSQFVAVSAAALRTVVRRRKPFRSGFKTLPLHAPGDEAAAAGRRAWATWVFTLSPNAYVVEVDRGARQALVHVLLLSRSPDRLP
jgi:multisubunit Na+/H+ antiporter MnhE subunit